MTVEKDDVSELQIKVENIMCPGGFEVHPFLVGWYNEVVAPKFHLNYPDSTLAFILISQPSMFEQSFLPYLSSQYTPGEIFIFRFIINIIVITIKVVSMTQ